MTISNLENKTLVIIATADTVAWLTSMTSHVAVSLQLIELNTILVGDELLSTLEPLPHRRIVAGLSRIYHYFQGK